MNGEPLTGTPGSITKTWTITNSVAGQPTVERVEPVDAVILVGDEDFTGTVTHTDKEEIPFEVEIVENPDLVVGTTNVKQQGVAGEKEVTYSQAIRNGQAEGNVTTTENQTKAPTKHIIEVGTKAPDSISSSTGYDIPFETEVIYNPDKPLGTSTVLQEGKNGRVEDSVETVFDPTTGKLINNKTGKEIKARKRVIEIGTKPIDSISSSTGYDIPFETEVIYNPDKPIGTVNVLQEGKPGRVEDGVETVYDPTTGKLINNKTGKEIKARKRVIEIGTKIQDKIEKSGNYEIPFETEIIYNPDKPIGTSTVLQEGKAGYIEGGVEFVFDPETNTYVANTTGKEIRPRKRVIEIGTKAPDKVSSSTGYDIPFETEVIYNPEKPIGTVNVLQEGKPGRVEDGVETVFDPETGKLINNKTGKEIKARKRVIEIGTKIQDKIEKSGNYDIPFETQVIYNPEKPLGTTTVLQEGKMGYIEGGVEFVFDPETNTYVANTTGKEVRPRQRVIEIGTKAPDKVSSSTGYDIPFETEVIYNPDKPLGTTTVLQEGKPGRVEDGVETVYDPETNTLINNKTGKEIKARKRVIEIGTKAPDKVSSSTGYDIPFETEVIYNPDKPIGTVNVLQEGKPGRVEDGVETVYDPETNTLINNKTGKEIKARKRVIEVGTKAIEGTSSEVNKEIPVAVEYVYDDTLDKGTVKTGQLINGSVTTKVVSKVVDGQVVNVEETIVTPGRQQIIVGTKDFTGEFSYTDKTVDPFETIYEYDDTLEAGQRTVIQEGVNGESEVTITQAMVNGQLGDKKVSDPRVTQEKQNRIVKIGSKPVVKEVDQPIETEIQYNENLEVGQVNEKQAGKAGKTTLTTTYDKDKHKLVTTESALAGEKRVIEVGTKPIIKEVELGYNTEYRHNPELKAGETKEITPGVKGKVTMTTSFNKETNQVETSENRVEPTTRIVEYGTKTEGSHTYTEDIAYDIEIIYDDTMAAGTSEVVQEGEVGQKEVTATIVDSQVTGTNEKVVKDPVKKIVKVGTLCKLPKPETPAGNETPGEENPGGNVTPGEETPGGNENPGEENPGGNVTPGEDQPGGNVTPGEETPGGNETPGEETPEDEKPSDQTPPSEITLGGSQSDSKTPSKDNPGDKETSADHHTPDKPSDNEKSTAIKTAIESAKSPATAEAYPASKDESASEDQLPQTGASPFLAHAGLSILSGLGLGFIGRKRKNK